MKVAGVMPPAFRLPDAARVGAVRLQVSDLPRSLAYYQEAIGLVVRSSSGGRAELGVPGGADALVVLHTRAGVTRARRGAFGLYHFAILLPDRSALGRFAAHASALGLQVGMADHLVSEALYLWDPDGLGIEVYADRPREAWRHRGPELVMTTDPLDYRSLFAAAGGAAWSGCPAGTVVGHVHLHVGSLDDAEGFYHRALGLDKTVWSYPGALFLAAGGYHHHLGTNVWSPGPAASADHAQLLEWELIVPAAGDVEAVARSLRGSGCRAEDDGTGVAAADPWGTRVRVRAA